MSKELSKNRVVQLLGVNPANRSDKILKEKGFERITCRSCLGEKKVDGTICHTCFGIGELYRIL